MLPTRPSSPFLRGSFSVPALFLASAGALFACVDGNEVGSYGAIAELAASSVMSPPALVLPPLKLSFSGDLGSTDTCHAVSARNDGTFVVTGELGRLLGHNAVVRGYSSAGTLLWNREITTPSEGDDSGVDVIALADKTAIAAGYWRSATGYNFFLQKLNATGGSLWRREGNVANGHTYLGVAVDGAGSLYVTGQKPDAGGVSQAWVRKLASDGATQLWENIRNGTSASGPDAANKVGVDGAGNIYVVGYVDNTATGTGRDGYIRKLGTTGVELYNIWLRSFGQDEVTDIGVAADGSLAIAGKVGTTGTVRRYSAAGALLWATSDATTTWRGVTLDSNGNVFATGRDGTSMVTRNFAAANGAVLWARTLSNASGEGVAIDGSGRTLVCGSENTGTRGTDGVILRYPN